MEIPHVGFEFWRRWKQAVGNHNSEQLERQCLAVRKVLQNYSNRVVKRQAYDELRSQVNAAIREAARQ